LLCAATISCGRKGPPLAPLRLVPAAPAETRVRRLGDQAQLRLVLPTKNAQSQGRLELDHIEIYAMTIAAGTPPPANRDLLTSKYAIGTIAVKPPPSDDEPAPAENAAADKRPAPGDTVTFVEELTAEKLKPVVLPVAAGRRGAGAPPPDPVPPVAPAAPPAAPAAAPLARVPGAPPAVPPVPPLPTYPVRVYGVRGITKGGRPGPPAARVQLPIVDVPPPPTSIKASNTEKSIVVEWAAPAAPAPATLAYNVYKPDGTAPLNPQPMTAATFESPGVEFGTEQCFAVRSVEPIGGVPIESALSAPVCFTPKDTFAPAAPKGVGAVARPGVVDITWDPNTEPDLAGYLVLRGEAANEAPVQLTPAPIADTHYLDSTAMPDVLYSYFIVAIDKSTPPNRSTPSTRYQITAK
jgi:hypothetical protein